MAIGIGSTWDEESYRSFEKEKIKANIRNKLSPFWNLSSMVDNYMDDRIDLNDFLTLIQKEAKQCEKNKEVILSELKRL